MTGLMVPARTTGTQNHCSLPRPQTAAQLPDFFGGRKHPTDASLHHCWLRPLPISMVMIAAATPALVVVLGIESKRAAGTDRI